MLKYKAIEPVISGSIAFLNVLINDQLAPGI